MNIFKFDMEEKYMKPSERIKEIYNGGKTMNQDDAIVQYLDEEYEKNLMPKNEHNKIECPRHPNRKFINIDELCNGECIEVAEPKKEEWAELKNKIENRVGWRITEEVLNDVKQFIHEVREKTIAERDAQIMSWNKIPIKGKLGEDITKTVCGVCGQVLAIIRGKYPNDSQRLVCPCCAIEILESIYSNLYPNSQACRSETIAGLEKLTKKNL